MVGTPGISCPLKSPGSRRHFQGDRSRRRQWSVTYAYRLPDGAVRGFVGRGPTRRDAYYDCIRRIVVKLKPFRRNFDGDEVVRDVAALLSGEQERVASDWYSQP